MVAQPRGALRVLGLLPHPRSLPLKRADWSRRAFYSDEHVVVLDALATNIFLREDELVRTFQLSQQQVKRILQQLQAEGLVHDEAVKEQGRRKADREAEDALRDGTAGTTKVMTKEQAEAAKAANRPRAQREGTITTVCWYINPRWFVDEVRFRIACVNEVLRKRQDATGAEKTLRCCSCGAKYSAIEAQGARAGAAAVAARVARSRADEWADPGGATAGAAAAAAAAGLACPKDGSPLERLTAKSVTKEAVRMTAKWQKQLGITGIQDLLDRLDRVPLGANRPLDHIRENRVSLRRSRAAAGRGGALSAGLGIVAAAYGTAKVSHQYSNASQRAVGLADAPGQRTSRSNVFVLGDKTVDVRAADGVTEATLMAAAAAAMGEQGAAADLARARAAQERKSVLARETAEEEARRAMPEHLRRSAITGDSTSALGFIRIAKRGDRRAALAAKAAAVWSSSDDDDDDDDDDDGAAGGKPAKTTKLAGAASTSVAGSASGSSSAAAAPALAAVAPAGSEAAGQLADADPVVAKGDDAVPEADEWGDADDDDDDDDDDDE